MDPKRLQFQSASSDNFDSACISACVYMDDVCVPTLVLPVSRRVCVWIIFAFPSIGGNCLFYSLAIQLSSDLEKARCIS